MVQEESTGDFTIIKDDRGRVLLVVADDLTVVTNVPEGTLGYDRNSTKLYQMASGTWTSSLAIATVTGNVVGNVTGNITGTPTTNGVSLSSAIRFVRMRKTAAEIKAGFTLVAAVAGQKIRMVDCKAIAYGGSVGATTSIDVTATQSAGSVILCSFLQASLTQSTVLKAGGTGATVLANGASFLQNDAATAITVAMAGADITVATGVDFIFEYTVEP